MTIKDRLARLFVGTRDQETGRREGGVAEAFRGGNGQTMMNPVSAMGDRIGRGVARRVNDWNTDRLESRHRQELIASERRVPPILGMPGPVAVDRPGRMPIETGQNRQSLTPEQIARYRNDSRSILHDRAGKPNPMAPVNRGGLTSYVDRNAATRAGSGTTSALNRAMQAINARGIGANMIE